ncbi:MAG: GDP-mannose 4,6-dehydratase, partial [Nocardioides sp.]
VREFVALAFRHAGIEDWESLVRTDPALTRPADAVALVGSPERARRRLGWRPTVTFETVVARMQRHDLDGSGAPTSR